jgi:hypothetical protein
VTEVALVPACPYVPILAAFRDGPHALEAWCGLCRRWHRHGPDPGHRLAHCDRERCGHFRLPQPVPHWTAYFLTLEHPDADIEPRWRRPKIKEPLGWRVNHVVRRHT